jgi:outer membrane protein assembly factor BamB
MPTTLSRPPRAMLAAIALSLPLALAACDTVSDTWASINPFDVTDKKVKLTGKRIPVLIDAAEIKPDPQLENAPVQLPEQQPNADWTQSGGNAAHAMPDQALGAEVKLVWTARIGSGADSDNPHVATPIVAGGTVYTMDTSSWVRAFSAEGGTQLWERSVEPKDKEVGTGDVGGALAYADGVIFVTNAFGEALALDAQKGEILWRRDLQGPTRAAPAVAHGRLYVVTQDNQLHALDAKTGRVLWTHSGLTEVTNVLGAASPALEGDSIVVPYTSGEIYALRADNGRVLWSDTLAAIKRADAVSALADIRANPVIDRDRVIAVSHSGRMVSIDLRSGARAWEDNIGGIMQPWAAGKFVFVLSTTNELICLTRDQGRVRWVSQLDRYEEPEKKKKPILWHGPVLAGDKLLFAGSNRQLLAVSPLDGKVLATTDLGDPSPVAPVVADRTLYVLTTAGDLKAFR